MTLQSLRLLTGFICNVMLIYLLLLCQLRLGLVIDYYRVKREAEEIERDSSAELTLLNTVTHCHTLSLCLTHTPCALIDCHVPVLISGQQCPSCPVTECDSYKPEEQR